MSWRRRASSFSSGPKTPWAISRNDLALEVTSPQAVLTAKDFTLEIAYALQPGESGGL